MENLLKEFRAFLFRGNVVDLAVAVVLGTAFGLVVKALVADLLTPIIALIFGQPNFGALSFTINSSHFLYGDFINNLITFVSVAAAIFFFVVKPMSAMAARRAQGPGRAGVGHPAVHRVPVGDPQGGSPLRVLHGRAVAGGVGEGA